MKINEITISDLKNYLHVYHTEDDKLLTAILLASKAFVKNYTGLSDDNLNISNDLSDDLSMVIFILASELYDNRTYTVDSANVNPVIQTILSMHSVNLL
jgi:Phage gp6-like head-tail connector protein